MKEVGSSSDNPSLEELIRKLYDALNDSQTQVLQEHIYSYKALIQTLLQACLLTPLKHKEQKLTTIQSKQALTTLKLINHAIQKIPEIIVYSTQCPLNSTPENTISFSQLYVPLNKNKFIVPCFECWLITHLTTLLFEEKFKNLYIYIIEIIFLIFKTLLDKSDTCNLFRQLFQDYIEFFKETLTLYLEPENPVYPINLICLKNKKNELEISLPNKDNHEKIDNISKIFYINVNNKKELQILLCNLCSVIENIFQYTIQYSSDFSNSIITMLIHNLYIIYKNYQLSEPLFLVLLKLCNLLVKLKIPISINHLEQLYFIVFSVMIKIFHYSEIKSSLNKNEQVEDRVIISYENYLAEILENLNQLLDPLKANLIYNYILDFWIILLDLNHFKQFKSQELKKSLLSSFKIFLDLSNTLPSEQIIESLIKILYHTQKDNAEIIIDCLIQYNALNNNNNNYNNDNNNINNNNNDQDISMQKDQPVINQLILSEKKHTRDENDEETTKRRKIDDNNTLQQIRSINNEKEKQKFISALYERVLKIFDKYYSEIKYEELNFINNLIDLIAQYYNESKLSLIFEKLNGLCNNYIADYFKFSKPINEKIFNNIILIYNKLLYYKVINEDNSIPVLLFLGIPWFKKLNLLNSDQPDLQDIFLEALQQSLPPYNTPDINIVQTLSEKEFISNDLAVDDLNKSETFWEYGFILICKLPTFTFKNWTLRFYQKILNQPELQLSIPAWKILPFMFNIFTEEMSYILEDEKFIKQFDTVEQLETISKNIGYFSCSLSHSLTIEHKLNDLYPLYKCSKCEHEGEKIIHSTTNSSSTTTSGEFMELDNNVSFDRWKNYNESILSHSDFNLKIFYMDKSLRRILNHVPLSDLDSKESAILHSCLQLITTSHSYILRKVIGSFFYIFLEGRSPEESKNPIFINNQNIIFKEIKKVLESEETPFDIQETILVMSAEMASKTTQDSVMQMVLHCLIDQLGKNTFAKIISFEQIQKIANEKKTTTLKLFIPFISAISIQIIQKIKTNPEILNDISVLFKMSKKEFVELSLEYVMPLLIIEENEEIIEEISKIIGCPIPELCIGPIHHILANILMQDEKCIASSSTFLLKLISSGLNNIAIGDMVRSCSLLLISKLALELGNEAKKERVLEALRVVITIINEKLSDEETPTNTEESLSFYLKHYFLGIISNINDQIMDTSGIRPIPQKITALKSLKELMILIGPNISSVSLQIVAILQATLNISFLRNVSLDVWQTFVMTLDTNSIIPLLSQIIIILLKDYSQYSSSQSKKIIEILTYLLVDNEDKFANAFEEISSFPDLPEFQKIIEVVNSRKEKITVEQKIKHLIKNALHESLIVSLEALKQLKITLIENQEYIQSIVMNEKMEDYINLLMKTLLDICRKYNGINITIQHLACECIGIIGAIDPERLKINNTNENHVNITNFKNFDESVNFVCIFIEKQLVGAFRSASNTKSQGFVAYAIQELLKFCKFTPDILFNNNNNNAIRKKWNQFPKQTLETIQPLLQTKYTVIPVQNKPVTYPLYPKQNKFKDWIQLWAVDLIMKIGDENAKQIFIPCKNVVKSEDINISIYLLPYLVLNVLINGTDEFRNEIYTEMMSVLNDNQEGSSFIYDEQKLLCTQTIFQVIDYLTKWSRLKRQQAFRKKIIKARRAGKYLNSDDNIVLDKDTTIINEILAKIPEYVMANVSFRSKAYARALLHFEQHIRKRRVLPNNQLEMQQLYIRLQEIYSNIDEPDGIEGISTLFTDQSLEQQIIENENAGKWTAAQTCYELLLQNDSLNKEYRIGLINCLNHLGHYESIISQVNGAISKNPLWEVDFNHYAVEASWKLEDWASLDLFLEKPCKQTFEVMIGKLISYKRKNKYSECLEVIQKTRETLTSSIAVASMESYNHCYEYIVKLHILYELETFFFNHLNNNKTNTTQMLELDPQAHLPQLQTRAQSYHSNSETSNILNFIKSLDSRLKITMPLIRHRENILTVRRTIISLRLNEIKDHIHDNEFDLLKTEYGRMWLLSAKLARKSGYSQTVYSCILHASQYNVPNIHIERAKWLKDQGELHKAISELQNALNIIEANVNNANNNNNPNSANVSSENVSIASNPTNSNLSTKSFDILDIQSFKYIKARTTLLLARWLEETNGESLSAIISKFKASTKDKLPWEKCYFYVARYYHKLYEMEKNKEDRNPTDRGQIRLANFLSQICKHYGLALMYGTKYIYQSLPRLLTIWLDYGVSVKPDENESSTNNERVSRLISVNQLIRKLTQKLPTYMFLTAFPQIISRICHKNKIVFQVLESIIITVLTVYPQQALWQMMSVSRSTYKIRAKRCNVIFSKVKSDPSANNLTVVTLDKLIQQALKMTDQLLNVCNFQVPPKENILSMSKEFRMLQRMTPLDLIVPLQSTLIPTLPSSNHDMGSHKPFPNELPTINGFNDEIDVMPSLQRPKKITIFGSNKKEYIFLCKPKDDLRKDCRLMEFNSMINKLLKKDPETRRRQLYIRTYAVVPLNEECGIIEWVNNTIGFRHILNSIYRAKNILTPVSELKEIYERPTPSPQKNLRIYYYQDVFHEWFLENFPEPGLWFNSRLCYSRTTAVMSMVGYILGLGDRHGENILFDDTNGDCVHVDFNCLFEKGLTFDKPEKVPFRLTHNMVDAFGVTKIEGVFRKCCEESLRVLRENRESLMSVLETFIHDPLCEWNKKRASEKSGEIENELALKNLMTIERKLQGIQFQNTNMPLSVEGQVHELIKQATSIDNLSVMYIGWAAYM